MVSSGAATVRVRITYAILLILLAILPWLGVYPVFVMKLLCFALFACALNLLLGYTGLLSFGHAALFGMAAYVCGWVTTALHWPSLGGLLAGMVTSALIGLVMGAVSIRRQGIYFAMITLAMAQIVFFFCLQAPFTGGEDGLQGVPRGTLFGVLSLDSGVDRYKLLAFVLSATLSGLAGSMKTLVMGFATLSDVHWSMSGEVILMTLVGGVGTFFGPVLGAGVVSTVQDELADRSEEHTSELQS